MRKVRRALPTKPDAPRGAVLALTNARRHLRAADALAKRRLFGLASSHVVLALEELAKSWTLTLVGMGIDVPKKMLADVMYKHDVRHTIIFGSLYSFVIQGLIVLAGKRVQQRHRIKDYPPELRPEFVREVKLLFKSLGSRSRKENPVYAVLQLTGGANDLKNRGLYVDFDGKKWIHPGSLSEKDFSDAYEIAKLLLRGQGQHIRFVNKIGFQADNDMKARMRDQFKLEQRNDPDEILKVLTNVALQPFTRADSH